ncbi:phosphonate C-P lyase system protein PhnG [Pontibacterium sp.]|uniref:phosphonate C-P lyase system protein PhnG n=1 Tax=Pontibacterium sp. TaxID=2036026 RepID=UPI0035187358
MSVTPQNHASDALSPEQASRKRWIGILAKAELKDLQQHWQALELPAAPEYQFIRKPETGLTMLRGRIGGSGQPFNMGEMTVTRCALRLASGTLGLSYIAGRSKEHAITAALADALLQEAGTAELLESMLINPLAAIQQAAQAERMREASSTKVDFFTMVRGED